MLGKLIGAFVGKKAAKHVGGVSETGGALIGAVAPSLLRRLGPVGLAAVAAGGYAYKRHRDKARGEKTQARAAWPAAAN